jgi:hypothetical protein
MHLHKWTKWSAIKTYINTGTPYQWRECTVCGKIKIRDV